MFQLSRHEVHRAVGIVITCCIHTGLHIAIGIIAHAVANIPERSLRCCQYREAFIAPLSTEQNKNSGLQMFIAPFETDSKFVNSAVDNRCMQEKGADGVVCAVGN
jgi:hypothetical protein